MIDFRCWYCNKRHRAPEERIGERIACTCANALRVPRRSDGNCRINSLADRLVEALAYGGGGALLGLVLALGINYFVFAAALGSSVWVLLAALPAAGCLPGFFGRTREGRWSVRGAQIPAPRLTNGFRQVSLASRRLATAKSPEMFRDRLRLRKLPRNCPERDAI